LARITPRLSKLGIGDPSQPRPLKLPQIHRYNVQCRLEIIPLDHFGYRMNIPRAHHDPDSLGIDLDEVIAKFKGQA
jgi:hypothetical protein